MAADGYIHYQTNPLNSFGSLGSLAFHLKCASIRSSQCGNIVCHSQEELRVSVRRKFLGKLLCYEKLNVPLIKGSEVVLHMCNIECPVIITKMSDVVKNSNSKNAIGNGNGDGNGDGNGGGNGRKTGHDGARKKKWRLLAAGDSGVIKVKVAGHRKLCMETFSDCRALGRFILRRNGETVGMGVITELLETKVKKKV